MKQYRLVTETSVPNDSRKKRTEQVLISEAWAYYWAGYWKDRKDEGSGWVEVREVSYWGNWTPITEEWHSSYDSTKPFAFDQFHE